MNNYQKHISKMTKVDLDYINYSEIVSSFYKNRKKLRSWSREYKSWTEFKKFSEWIRD